MKRNLLILILGYFCLITSAQISKTVNVSTGGLLASLLTENEKSTVTNLIVTGEINQKDVFFMRDNMKVLSVLDISNTVIKKSYDESGYLYSENEIQFTYGTQLTQILLPSSLTSISSFSDCINLASIDIPNTVVNIESNAFENTAWLNNKPNGVVYAGNVVYKYKGTMPSNSHIEIRTGIVTIAPSAFSKCSGLTSISIPNTLETIRFRAFSDCINLSTIFIPNSVNKIEEKAFENTNWFNNQPDGIVYGGNAAYKYKGLMPPETKVEIKTGTVSIGYEAFAYYSNLSQITIPNTVKDIDTGAFGLCTGLTSISIPSSVLNIGKVAFAGCSSLTSISIPNSVIEIGTNAFYGLTRLKSIYSYLKNPMELAAKHFEKTNNAYCTLYVPTGTTNKYIQASGWNYFLNIVEFDATTALKTFSSSDLGVNYSSVSKSIILKGIDKPCSIVIYNFSGKTCYLNKCLYSNQSINANSLPQGIYVVKITVNNEVISRKIQVF